MPEGGLEQFHPGALTLREKIIALIVLAVGFMTIWFMLDIALLTFILTFIFFYAMRFLKNLISMTPLVRLPDGVFLVTVFLLGIALISLGSIAFAPLLVQQVTEIARAFIRFDFDSFREALDPRIAELVKDLNIESYVEQIGVFLLNTIMKVGTFGVNVLLAIALSFLLLLEKKKIYRFGEKLSESRLDFIFYYLMLFGTNFCRTFGKVMKVQITIAFINAVVSAVVLTFFEFPNILGLAVMIFLLGLVPVAGVVISLIPLSIIAFNVGGIICIVKVVVLIVLMHVVEAYVLNPKLMSSRTSLPVSFVFIILLVAQEYLKVWGLLIGVPLFIFLMTMFGVDYQSAFEETRKRRRLFSFRKKDANAGAATGAAATAEADAGATAEAKEDPAP